MQTLGEMVRHWRRARRLSQLDLAERAEVSTRHLSFVETGKARPSREMVLLLGSALELPLRDRNTLLQAAGFAPAYRETDLSAPEMADVRHALELVLAQPLGAVVFDRMGEILVANDRVRALSQWLVGAEVSLAGTNLYEATLVLLRPFLVNWEDVVRAMFERLRREAFAESDDELADLHDRLAAMPGIPPELSRPSWDAVPPLLIPVVLRKDDVELRFFTTLTTLGTPTDITLSELRIETYHPADDATRDLMTRLGS